MAKNTAPLFGFDAAGTLGKSITYSTWRGVKYTRRYASPSNPKTAQQTETRDIFSALNSVWKLLPAGVVAPWTAFAAGQSFVDRNAFIGHNVKLLRNEVPLTTMVTIQMSPGAGGGSPPSAMALTPGATQISVALTLPEVPTGWVLTASRAIAFIDQAPADPFSAELTYVEELATPQTLVLTGLVAAELYVVAAFLKWTKPNGDIAYSVSLTDTATPTA